MPLDNKLQEGNSPELENNNNTQYNELHNQLLEPEGNDCPCMSNATLHVGSFIVTNNTH